MIKIIAKWLLHLLCGEYSIYSIYSRGKDDGIIPLPKPNNFKFSRIEAAQIEASKDLIISDQAGYHGHESYAYGYLDGSRIVGVCFFWCGDRYKTRNFWTLLDGESKLVQIVTVPDMRGSGIATSLVIHASSDMFDRGFRRLYARIWHSNYPSIRAFERAGWKHVATVIEFNPFRRKAPFRIAYNKSM